MKSTPRIVFLLGPLLLHCTTTTTMETTPASAPGPDASTETPADGGAADAAVDHAPSEPDAYYAAMTRPRCIFPSISGKDGRIHSVGGMSSLGVANDVDIYDSTTNTWKAGAGSAQRYGHAATATKEGDVFVVGGTPNGTTPVASAAIYSVSTNTWTKATDMPTARLGLGAATAPDGRIYAIGGRGNAGLVDVVEVYSPETKTWSTAPSLPTKRLAFVAVAGADGKIYAIGGRDADDTPLKVVESFDPATGTWTTVQPMNTARFWFGATLGGDNRIYVVGGVDAGGEFLDAAEALTPGSGWVALAAMPEARGWVSAAASTDGRIFAIGGAPVPDVPTGGSPPPVATMLGYDVKTNTWKR